MLSQIFSPIAELVMSTETKTNETNVETETQPVNAEANPSMVIYLV